MTRTNTPHIVMAATSDLATDQRVLRHAAALREGGCKVLLVGRELPASRPLRGADPAVRLRLRHRRGWRFYAEYNRRLLALLLRQRADILWANDLDTLPACWLAARLTGRRVVLDAHELFPEVPELADRPRVKRVWERLERWLLPRCDARLTVCRSIADHYRRRYGVEVEVVRNLNGERRTENGKRKTESATHYPLPTIHPTRSTLLYQGAVNLGRGVDWAIDALQWLDDCRLVVAGDGDLLPQMQAYAASKPWAARVTFTGRLLPDELRRLTSLADVGLVMLEDLGLSYHYALPNRVADFVQAGVPIVVSDLPEMAAVVHRFGVGEVMQAPGARPLADSVRRVLARRWSAGDFAPAQRDMDWTREKTKLTQLASRLTRQQPKQT